MSPKKGFIFLARSFLQARSPGTWLHYHHGLEIHIPSKSSFMSENCSPHTQDKIVDSRSVCLCHNPRQGGFTSYSRTAVHTKPKQRDNCRGSCTVGYKLRLSFCACPGNNPFKPTLNTWGRGVASGARAPPCGSRLERRLF